MIYRPKNKNTEATTSKIYKQDKPKQTINHKKINQPKFITTRFNEIDITTINKSDHEIINRLEKHIQYLEKQLKMCDETITKINYHNDTMKEIIRQKQLENRNLFKSIESYQQSVKSISVKFDELQSNYDRLKCKQKIESQDTQGQKKTELKHRLYKKGNYSAAFLPPAFGSPQKFQKHKKSQYNLALKEEQIDEVESNRILVRHPMSGYLIDEWQKSTVQINIKQKQMSLLQTKLTNCRRQIVKQQKEIERLNATLIQKQKKQKHSIFELNMSKDKLKTTLKQNKLILGKLKAAQQKIVQLTTILKQQKYKTEKEPITTEIDLLKQKQQTTAIQQSPSPQTSQIIYKKQNTAIETIVTGTDQTLYMNEDDKFYNYSSIEQIRSMVERINYKLQIESYTVDTCIDPLTKQSIGTQTLEKMISAQDAQQKVIILQNLNRQLQNKTHMKQLQHMTILDQEKQRFRQQLKEYTEVIEQYKLKIEQYNFMLKQYEAEKNNWRKTQTSKNPEQNIEQQPNEIKKLELIDANSQCDIVPNDIYDERQQILQKAKMLIQFNQEQANTIQQLKSQIQHIRQTNNAEQRQIQSHFIDQTQNVNNNFQQEPNSHINEGFVTNKTAEIGKFQENGQDSQLLCKIQKLKQQRDYFSECYNQTLSNLKNLELQFQKQIAKTKQQHQDKQRQISNISNDLTQKNQQLYRVKQELEDYQTKIKIYEDDIEGYKLQLHQINELYNLQKH